MTDPIRGSQPAAKPTTKSAPLSTAIPPAPTMESDSFVSRPPTAAQLEAMRKAVAALDGLPKVPSGVEAKRAWIEANKPVIEAAQKAVSGLGSAEFFHKALPKADVEAAQAKFGKVQARLHEAEEEAGLRKPEAPGSPFRPLWGFSNATRSMMGNPIGAVAGAILIVPAILLDMVDAVTRPIQAVAYPFVWGKYKLDQAQYEAARKK